MVSYCCVVLCGEFVFDVVVVLTCSIVRSDGHHVGTSFLT